MEKSSLNQENLSYLIVIGFILITGIVGTVYWTKNMRTHQAVAEAVVSGSSQGAFSRARLTPVPTVDPVVATAQAEVSQVATAFTTGGCIACHTISGIPNAVGQIGPDLSQIGVEGATRQDGLSAEAYIRQSILEPNAFIAPKCPTGDCPTGVMPTVALDPANLELIVGYLTTLGLDK